MFAEMLCEDVTKITSSRLNISIALQWVYRVSHLVPNWAITFNTPCPPGEEKMEKNAVSKGVKMENDQSCQSDSFHCCITSCKSV